MQSTSMGPDKYLPTGPQAAAQLFIDPVIRSEARLLRKEALRLGWTQSQGHSLTVLLGGQGELFLSEERGRGHAFGFGVCVLKLARFDPKLAWIRQASG